jgi:PIN domain nuclease of toxin-antitoxin system
MGIVKYVLDTHALLWAVSKNSRLTDVVFNIIEDANIRVFASAVNAYEIMNKHRLGKLSGHDELIYNYTKTLRKMELEDLPITTQHAHFAGKMDWAHRDPFDRLLAAQAHIEKMVLITDDAAFEALQWVDTVW